MMAERGYVELVKALRGCCSELLCPDCYLWENGSCKWQMRNDAADAIEDLLRKMGAKDSAIEFGLKRIEKLQAENEQLKDQVPQWISVDERLPEDEDIVLVYWCNAHCCERDNYSVMRFHKGRTAEELKAASSVRPCDQWGNNKKPYCWNDPHGPLSLFGQDVTYWMPLPEPPLEEYELEGGIFDPYFVEGFE